jgi:hypothetical protein
VIVDTAPNLIVIGERILDGWAALVGTGPQQHSEARMVLDLPFTEPVAASARHPG